MTPGERKRIMAYEVLARKWRPQQFDDVVGQAHVITTLKNAIQSERVAHAYLFVGPRGVGKTTIARIFARALNCVKGPAAQACGVCDSCREISNGSNLDVQEIDAASNRGIDNIRELRENARFMPQGRFKIYIIDEVHMLTTEAFNALLKTLEEPPPHLKFFMATTDPQKIPATILSRCQRFDLRRIPIPLIVERLDLIARDEKVDVDHDALLALARGAEGGLRDAESALDQMISFQGRQIKEADVLAAFGLVSRQSLETMSAALLAGDILTTVKMVAELDEHGKDMQRLLVELLEHFRNLLIYVEIGADAAAGALIESDQAVLARQAGQTDAGRLLRMTDILMETLDRLRYALSRRTLVETALIRCARLADAISLDAVLDQINALKNQLGVAPADNAWQTASRPQTALRPQAAPSPQTASRPQAASREETAGAGAGPSAPPGIAGGDELKLKPAVAIPEPVSRDLAHLLHDWHLVVERVGRSAIRARTCLLDAAPMAVLDDKVVIGIDREFADRREQLQQSRNRLAVQKALEETLKRPVSVEFEICDKLPAVSGVPPARGDVSSGKSAAGGRQPAAGGKAGADAKPAAPAGGKAAVRKWMADEKVQKVLDAFNGSIQEIRE